MKGATWRYSGDLFNIVIYSLTIITFDMLSWLCGMFTGGIH